MPGVEIGDVIDLPIVPCYDRPATYRSFAMNPDICVSMCPHGQGLILSPLGS